MKNINDVRSEYLVNVKTERASVRIDIYTKWNSMTLEDREGWYEANQEHLTFSRETAQSGLERMIRDMVRPKGYDGMEDAVIKVIEDEHIDNLLCVLEDITRGPAFLVFEEFGEMIDPNIDVNIGGEN